MPAHFTHLGQSLFKTFCPMPKSMFGIVEICETIKEDEPSCLAVVQYKFKLSAADALLAMPNCQTNHGLYCTQLTALRTKPLPLLVAEILKCFPDKILFITFVPVIRVSIPTAFPPFTKNGIAGRNRSPNPYAF
ncbi:hypothetical protein CEXT_762291 [Caerostris extrusa]|uniref:Uncharacterized protein n=1 Tax=Caerostris extrusa TaxID=172846 RepID=A0AAV4NF14_CAEEX|nr:hypothetical protein CEXT_762291 [Caerostris extrusa]